MKSVMRDHRMSILGVLAIMLCFRACNEGWMWLPEPVIVRERTPVKYWVVDKLPGWQKRCDIQSAIFNLGRSTRVNMPAGEVRHVIMPLTAIVITDRTPLAGSDAQMVDDMA